MIRIALAQVHPSHRLAHVRPNRRRLAASVLAAVALALGVAPATPVSAQPSSSAAAAPAAKPAGQGIAVVAIGGARDEAFSLARAVYASRLRPSSLDEVRARVLAGAPPPPNASRELRDLAEVRAGIPGEDAAGRRLMTGLAAQVGAQALLVVTVERSPSTAPMAPAATPPNASVADGGAAADPSPGDGGAGAGEPVSPSGNASGGKAVVARLFLAETGEFDAARYSPEPGLEGAAAWKTTVTSLEARFPATSRVGPAAATALVSVKSAPDGEKSSPFYTSGWFWGAVGGAALVGAAFFFASRDTGEGTIHLQMRVPK